MSIFSDTEPVTVTKFVTSVVGCKTFLGIMLLADLPKAKVTEIIINIWENINMGIFCDIESASVTTRGRSAVGGKIFLGIPS